MIWYVLWHIRRIGAHAHKSGDSDEGQFHQQLSKVSFGALAKAQDTLSQKQSASRKRKRGEDTLASQEDKLEALRERLREIKAEKAANATKPSKKSKSSTKVQGEHDSEEESEDSDMESSDSDGAPRARSSKHAPAVQSSKRQVTRKRNVIEVKKSTFRDPRFDNISGARPDENTLMKRYAFLDEYKASEMAELRTAIKKTKNEEEKEKLKRKLLSMESQKKSREAKEKQQEITREHKKKEKELVKQGKKPFYLKKCTIIFSAINLYSPTNSLLAEQKKRVLIDRFQNMKSKQRDKVIERRRKKAVAKERKNMPAERRGG